MNNDKPISIVLDDFKIAISNVITRSGLHPSIIEPILCNIYSEIHELAQRQLEIEREEYEKQIKANKNEKNKETTKE